MMKNMVIYLLASQFHYFSCCTETIRAEHGVMPGGSRRKF